MTPEQINQSIAKACGWRKSMVTGKWIHATNESDKHFNSAWVSAPPDYYNDLNACQEAFLTLKYPQTGIYLNHLHAICKYTDGFAECASAPQRCEAFLRALGLWEETK